MAKPATPTKKNEDKHRVNEEIRNVMEVRLVGDNIEHPGIFTFARAMELADEMGLDLVEISASANPPVCKIIDYQKFLYQQKKHEKEMKAKSVKVVIKEIRFGPQTDEHDYNFKLRHAEEFLKTGNKVKASVFFRGRSIMFKEQGEEILLRFANDLEELGRVDSLPKLEGKRMMIMISPKSNKN
ncbi:MAG: translation initiation factor IF-3 [Bacteroidales bacterium]|nr:translation initiation factor IF-3 [Bacteroidales bacterium]